ncbi:MAG TPA: threonine synthase [bacterium]|nr:threonine synthase [bacterium]HPN42217.1 threonine synthase [bacterium]
MKLYSTKDHAHVVNFRDALFKGQAADRGLYMPAVFPRIPLNELVELSHLPFAGMARAIAGKYLGDEIPAQGLDQIINRAYSFAPALQSLDEYTDVMELFHGPTLSFKDFGAQFMAQAMRYFIQDERREITILVATSGDTGSAVAHAYHKVEGIRIVLLYPSGKISPLQEKQFTTLGDNIMALEVAGTFDDCQALVKQAFADTDLRDKQKLTSANSINIGRLIPQSFYYFWSVMQVYARTQQKVIVCVPSGNFGNLTAGLFAAQMGLPVQKFIAAVNSNHVIPDYFDSGKFTPRPSVLTLSNAMDVGNPSNWERICDLFHNDVQAIKQHIWTTSVDDSATVAAMQRVYKDNNYVIDPHTAVGLEAVRRYRETVAADKALPVISLSTAHPGKFIDIVNDALHIEYQLPDKLEQLKHRQKQATAISAAFKDFKELLWEL